MKLNVKRTTIALGTACALAVPTALAVATPANADVERHGSCGGGTYELSVDREDGGFEVSADVDRVEPGSRWRVVLRHDGNRFYRNVLRADHEGDLDVERFRTNTAGSDTFRFRAKRLGSTAGCGATITVS